MFRTLFVSFLLVSLTIAVERTAGSNGKVVPDSGRKLMRKTQAQSAKVNKTKPNQTNDTLVIHHVGNAPPLVDESEFSGYITMASDTTKCLQAMSQENYGLLNFHSCGNPIPENQQWYWDTRKKLFRSMSPTGSYCLDAWERNTEGGKVHLWDCDASNQNQLWDYAYGSMQFEEVKGLCLAKADAGHHHGSDVFMKSCNDLKESERFQFLPLSHVDEVSNIFSYMGKITQEKDTNNCLEATGQADYAKLRWEQCNDANSNQKWSYSSEDKLFRSQGRHGTHCLDAWDRNTEGGRVHLWLCDASNHNQLWVYVEPTAQFQEIHGYCLATSTMPEAEYSDVVMQPCNSQDIDQHMIFQPIE